jgi:serine/threonine-protein kinase
MTEPGPCGAKIDRYLVKHLLGVGGFGAVYAATHTRTDAQVALKVLKKDRAEDAAAVERFMREARAAAMLGSEHIVRVLDAEVSAEGVPFIAMELLTGIDLSELDKTKGPIHPERLINIMVQTLEALQAAHEKGIVHRDMKPANVFITKKRDALGVERDFVKLLDFGISKMQASGERVLTLAGTTMGTPAYMAYEQFFDARSVDGRADVYSVAAILYELLSRQKPYLASSYGELVMKVEKEVPLPLKQVAPMMPDTLCAVVDKGLKKDRDERWQSARELADALKQVGPLRGVVLKTEIAVMGVARVEETKAHVPTTEPRPVPSSRGEVKTVMMDLSSPEAPQVAPVENARLEEPVVMAGSRSGDAGVEAGNATIIREAAPMPEPAPPAPAPILLSREVVGNATVIMPPPAPSDATPIHGTPPVSRGGAVGNSTVMIDPSVLEDEVPTAPRRQQPALDVSERPTSPAGLKELPKREATTQESVVDGAKPGLLDALGWKLIAALGAGAMVVVVMLIWVISLASRRGH